MADEIPTFDDPTGVPRLPSREATNASRGFVAGWAQAIDLILGAREDDNVYLEAFEDIAVVASSGVIGGIQIKDKAGQFSVTQEESCGMLERWAVVVEERPGSWFRFCSTQSAGNLHNHSASFARWTAGHRDEAILAELCESIRGFVSGKHKGKFQRMERLTQNQAEFRKYWECIDWKLNNVDLTELRQKLLDRIGYFFPNIESKEAEKLLYAWIGAIALSASSDDISERCWTTKKLFAIDPKINTRMAYLASQIERLVGAQSQEQATTLTEILDTVRGLKNWSQTIGFSSFARSPTGTSTGALALPPTRAQQAVQDSRVAQLETRLRKALDCQAQQLWDEIRGKIHGAERTEAVASRPKLQEWFYNEGQSASPHARGRAAMLLADLTVIESSEKSALERIDTASFREWLNRAGDILGSDISPDDAGRLVNLNAKLLWFEGRRAEALSTLDAIDDDVCRSLKLAMHLEVGNNDLALGVARTLPTDERWVDQIVVAYARHGLETEAACIFSWAQQQTSPVPQQRCALAWVQGTLQRMLKPKNYRSIINEHCSEEENLVLRNLMTRLQPLITTAVAQGRPITGCEQEAVELAITIARFLNDRSQSQRLGIVLSKAERTSLEYARAVCRGDLPSVPNLAERLRRQYPDSFVAGHLAAAIDVIDGKGFARTLATAESLLLRVRDKDDREQVAALVFETALNDDTPDLICQAIDYLKKLLEPEHILNKLATFEKLRRAGDVVGASAALENAKDEANPVWLQLAAEWHRVHGSKETSLDFLSKASRLIGRPETCWKAFSIALELNDLSAMRELMETVLRLDAGDAQAIRNLAKLDFNGGKFADAVPNLRRLEQIEPDSQEVGLFLGRALSLCGQLEEAIKVFDRICDKHPGNFEALYLKTITLDSVGRPAQAFQALHDVRESFWADTPFLLHYHAMGYKANREEEAHLAFIRLHEMKNGDSDGPLRTMTLDQFKEHARTWQKHHETMNEKLVSGTVPWMLVGHALRRDVDRVLK